MMPAGGSLRKTMAFILAKESFRKPSFFRGLEKSPIFKQPLTQLM
jgi:hypothetical protein